MKAKFKEYQLLDGSRETQIEKVGSGNVIRRFDKTPVPVKPTDVICPHFMLCAWSYGCPYACAWCYLQGTYRWYKKNGQGRVPMRFKDPVEVEKALTSFIRLAIPPEVLNTGELSDSLMAETRDPPFSKWIMSFIKGTKHRVLFLSKGTQVKHFLETEWQKNAILSWSLNAVKVANQWEHLAPSPLARIEAAEKVYNAGYEVRVRIDPMVAVENWRVAYKELIDYLFKRLTPARVTLGCLRGLTSTVVHASDKSWVKYLHEKSSWGRKPSFDQRLTMYTFVIDYLANQYDFYSVGICKDTLAMWRALNMDFKKISCNCTW